MSPISLPKILVLLGPTATGKSDLAVELAHKFNGEIISADSRQVYVGLNIGTGKITAEEMKGVHHHLLDIANPRIRFGVIQWKNRAKAAIADIVSRGKLPIICGGTGFYIQTLIDNLDFPDIGVDEDGQRELENKSSDELFAELQILDSRRSAEIDPSNKRRVARAILIARQLGSVPPVTVQESQYDALFIGLTLPDSELKKRINARLIKRIETSMIEEAQKLYSDGLSYERMEELGLEYKYIAHYLQNKISRDQLVEILTAKIWQYARRQKTWFKRNKQIHWFSPTEKEKIDSLVLSFLSS